ncbi:hypothetical protein ACIQ7D_01185 [Streptomyces sp. NPDC096310]|uniref:hypothetical protein n=1 Tax=Streptomyces sp. NPDC096310 TaxID=3366082 RepID=UPI003809F3D2
MVSGNLISTGFTISCPHGGRVAPASGASSGVRLDGLPVPAATDTFTVTGCRHTVDRVPYPCVTVRWTPGQGRDVVRIDGSAALLDSTSALCFSAALVPQGPPVVTPLTERGVCTR